MFYKKKQAEIFLLKKAVLKENVRQNLINIKLSFISKNFLIKKKLSDVLLEFNLIMFIYQIIYQQNNKINYLH